MTSSDLACELRYSEKTIVFADVVESVRLMERDEPGAIRRIRDLLEAIAAGLVQRHGGRVIEHRGDGLLLEFPDARAAAACAADIHRAAHERSASLDAQDGLHVRVGIHQAAVVADDHAVFGAGVNLAARITGLAGPGETMLSAVVAGYLVNGVDGVLQDLGDCHLKHVAEPVRVYRIASADVPKRDDPPAIAKLLPMIAIMPFTGYAQDGGGMGVGDIISDQLIGALSRSNSVNVISRLSTTALRGRELAVHAIAERLAADFVVSGRFWRSGDELCVQVELASGSSGTVIWAQTVSDSEQAALHIDSELIASILRGIAEAIFATEVRRVRTMPLPNVATHSLLLAAISLLYRLSLSDFERAHQALLAVNERVPRHAAPLAWLARWHLFRVVQGWSDDRDLDGKLALSYADRALDIDPDSSLALTMAGNVRTSYLRDLDAAEVLYDHALSVNPSESLAWLQKGNARSFRGDGAGALRDIEKAVSLSPLDPSRHFYESLLASAALAAGDHERAIAAAQSSLRMNSNHVSTHRVLAIAQSLSGRLDEACATVKRIRALEPRLTVASYVARSPARASGLAQKFGEALHRAGLPLDEGSVH
jgi:class 3 adenylate cyclase/tetratricopeptide (TPR) repeat protein